MPTYVRPGVLISEVSLHDPLTEQWLNELPDIGPLPPKLGKKWEHDCAECKYQGSLVVDDQHYDFYICKMQGFMPLGYSYVARFGNDGRYTSFPGHLLPDLQLGLMGAAEGVLQTLHLLGNAKWSSEEFGFCVEPTEHNSVHVVVNPLGDPRVIRYVADAVAMTGPSFQYARMDDQTMWQVVFKISELVHQQIKRDR